MKRPGFRFLLITIILMLSSITLYAQEGDADSNLLPEIDPQDIEIRSEYSARFPGLRRQPILGFNPEPSVYQVDPNRQPFMESREEVVANLPITDLSRPAAPPRQALNYEPEIKAFGRLGVGNFVSPEAEFWGTKRFSEKSYVSGKMDYHSTNGHLDPENSSFRFFDADAEYATKMNENTSLKLSGGMENSFNRLFELDDLNTLVVDVPSGPRKKYTGFNAGVALNQHENSVEGWSADAGLRWFDMDMSAGDIGGNATESIFNASFQKEWAGSRIQETYGVQVSGRGGSYDLSSQNSSQNWMSVRAGGKYARLLDYSTQITANADVVYTSNAVEDRVYPGFSLKAKHWIQDNLTIAARLTGNPKVQTIEQLNNLNRFLNHQTPLRHTYAAEGAGEVSFEYLPGSSLHAEISYMQARNYAYFGRNSLPSTTDGYYGVNYMNANKIKGEVGATHQLVPEKFWVDARAYVQKPKLDNGSDIPFEESWGINSGISAKLFEKLRIEAWADYISERNTLSSVTLGGFLLAGGQVDIELTERIGVYAKMMNLLSQEYEIWSGYEERPFQAYGGITVKLQ